eukprot:1112647-Ditylum_brightwellii.AAC.1
MTKMRMKDGKGELVATIKSIQHCKEMRVAFKQMKPITKGITGGNLKELLKKQNKVTSYSPSGHCYGHYKVLVDHEDVLVMHCIMITLPFQHGFTPQQWLKPVDVMLEKDPGSPRLHRLRIIVMLEANMNMIMKIIWARRLLPHTETHNTLS